MKKSELLSPAGTLKNLRYALAYGADAVYAGQPRYSLRVRHNNFDQLDHLAQGIQETHAQNKRFYLACNLFPHHAKLKTFLTDIQPIIDLGPDALIMADPGLITLVRERWPDLTIHLSVQANTVNAAATKFWHQVGITRVILSRELSLEEIAEIRQACPEIELEVFIHGALCIAYSGRCLLSGYMNHRDANQGACTNACRWNYRLHSMDYSLEEQERPGEFLPIFEDEHGTYIMNSKDLCAVRHVAHLMEMGIDSLKIEGRTKSHYYVARTAQVYRQAIDNAWAGQAFDAQLLHSLEKLSHRGYTEGFYQRHAHQEYQNYRAEVHAQQQFVGEIIEQVSDRWLVEVKNHFTVGDTLELICPQGSVEFKLEHMENLAGERILVAPGSGYQVWLDAPIHYPITYGLLTKNLVKE